MSTLISGIDDKAGSESEVAEWSKYAASELTYHVSHALQTPYAKDELASRLLTHHDANIAVQVVHGSKRAEADALSAHLLGSESYWPAAKLNCNLSLRSGLTVDDKCNYMVTAVDALQHVRKESQPGSLGLLLHVSGRILVYNRSEAGTELDFLKRMF